VAANRLRMTAYLISCPERESIRNQTLVNLQATDWADPPKIGIDHTTFERRQERQVHTALRLLQRAIAEDPEFILFLEDDLQFNKHLRYNLNHWRPLDKVQPGDHFFGSLYNPNVRELERNGDQAFFVADPESIYGSQAFILSLATAQYIVAHWEEVDGLQDFKMSRLAARLCPTYYHVPSLVQHVGLASAWGGSYHCASDFDTEWKASAMSVPMTTSKEQPMIHTLSILDHMSKVEGWLDEAEAELLIAITQATCLTSDRHSTSIVEVGSYCGKSTIVLGLALKGLEQHTARVYAVDPHDGVVSTIDQGIMQTPPTFEIFSWNVREAEVTDVIEPIKARSYDVDWDKPIDLLFIDGLHDYRNVATDFLHFSDWVRPEGLVAFHDYGEHFPGVKRVVDELVSGNEYRLSKMVNSLVVLQKSKVTIQEPSSSDLHFYLFERNGDHEFMNSLSSHGLDRL
jgi:hypothetical protein